MISVSFCRLDRHGAGPFEGYILPTVSRVLASQETQGDFTVLGAIWDTLACAAAVVRWEGGEGELLSLFVDPQARRNGIGGHLVDLLGQEGRSRGAETLRCNYILTGEELTAMDALFRRRGAGIDTQPPVWGMNSVDFLKSPLLGPALRPGYAIDEHIVLFSRLTPEQMELLNTEPTFPARLRPAARMDVTDPGLSAAWIENGRPVACVMGCQSGETMFDQTGAWRGPSAPAGCFRKLVGAQINHCWYRCGGDFRFFLSAISQESARMAEWFTEGKYEWYEQHEAELYLPEDGEDREE